MAFDVDLSLPDDFANVVRLFPLPNVVLFPGVMQGLHIFEPRYRQMMDDALVTDQLITMAVLKSTEQKQAEEFERADIYSTVCIGKIVTHSRMDDGRYNLLLVGVKRANIVREIVSDKTYCLAEIELLDDVLDVAAPELAELRQNLIVEFRRYASVRQGMSEETIKNMFVDSMPFGLLVDLVCYAIGLHPEDQVKVLQAQETSRRCELVLDMLKRKRETHTQSHGPKWGVDLDFPPGFSLN